jgi:hypothetical protein
MFCNEVEARTPGELFYEPAKVAVTDEGKIFLGGGMLNDGFRVRAARRRVKSEALIVCFSQNPLHPGLRQRITDNEQLVTVLALQVVSYKL